VNKGKKGARVGIVPVNEQFVGKEYNAARVEMPTPTRCPDTARDPRKS
jgi:hypothetical protein